MHHDLNAQTNKSLVTA